MTAGNKDMLLMSGMRKEVVVSVKKEWINKCTVKCFSQILSFHITTSFSSCLQKRI